MKGEENPADLLTEHLCSDDIQKNLDFCGFTRLRDIAPSSPTLMFLDSAGHYFSSLSGRVVGATTGCGLDDRRLDSERGCISLIAGEMTSRARFKYIIEQDVDFSLQLGVECNLVARHSCQCVEQLGHGCKASRLT